MEHQHTLTVHAPANDTGLGERTWKNYLPLFTIISIIVLTTVAISIHDIQLNTFSLEKSMSYFMIGFFLTFGTFKLINLKGFADGYQTYDLLAMRARWYAYLYPFIELSFGFGMILMPLSKELLIVESIVMAFSGLGVAQKLAKKEPIICACLGTFLKVPLTNITLIENFGMAALALGMLMLL